METVADGTLTIATDDPAYEPWFVDNDPTNGKGYESAVAYAVAEQLGYTQDQVAWVTVPFNKVVQPGPKDFDFDVNQVSITEARRKAVDFSSGYYDVVQTVITNKGSAIDGITSLADLADAKLGAQVGTTSYTAITDQIQPSQDPAVFDTNDQAVQALKNGQIDGIVVDLPTAFYVTAVQVSDGVIIGKLPTRGTKEHFGMVLQKGNSLTGCVNKALDRLWRNGTIKKLQTTYLARAGAPDIK
jgi:polar amino acid transport system substrate-binding protein